MKPLYIIPLLSIFVLAGCAQQPPKPPKTQENFSTSIKPDGTKQFSYILTMEMPERKDMGGQSHGGPGDHGGRGGPGGHHDGPPGDHKGKKGDGKGGGKNDGMDEEFASIFDDALNVKLNSTGFCHSGFRSLDTQARRGAKLVKGECNESATDEDRKKFPNPPPKKVKVDVLE